MKKQYFSNDIRRSYSLRNFMKSVTNDLKAAGGIYKELGACYKGKHQAYQVLKNI